MNGFTGFEWTYRRPPGRFVQNKNDVSKLYHIHTWTGPITRSVSSWNRENKIKSRPVTLPTILKKIIHRFPITWFNFTCNHALPGHTPGDLLFSFSFLEVYSPPQGTQTKRDKSPPPSSWSTSYTCFGTIFFDPYKSKVRRFHNF